MIAGISAIIDPRGPDGDQMRKILTTFLEQNPWHEAVKKDETTRKEVQIVCPHYSYRLAEGFQQILTLSRRAAQIYEDSFGSEGPQSHDKDSVALLLALGQAAQTSGPVSRPVASQTSPPTAFMMPVPGRQFRIAENGAKYGNQFIAVPRGPFPTSAPRPLVESPTTPRGSEDDHTQQL